MSANPDSQMRLLNPGGWIEAAPSAPEPLSESAVPKPPPDRCTGLLLCLRCGTPTTLAPEFCPRCGARRCVSCGDS
jgi:hypothetical protein